MQAAKRIADVCFTQESEKMQLILSFQLPDLPLYDLCRFLRLIIKLRIHMVPESREKPEESMVP